MLNIKPALQWVEALADILRSDLCCHSNENRAPIANLPNNAQLESTPYHSPKQHRVGAVVRKSGEGQTDRHTDGCGQYTFHLSYASRKI